MILEICDEKYYDLINLEMYYVLWKMWLTHMSYTPGNLQ